MLLLLNEPNTVVDRQLLLPVVWGLLLLLAAPPDLAIVQSQHKLIVSV